MTHFNVKVTEQNRVIVLFKNIQYLFKRMALTIRMRQVRVKDMHRLAVHTDLVSRQVAIAPTGRWQQGFTMPVLHWNTCKQGVASIRQQTSPPRGGEMNRAIKLF